MFRVICFVLTVFTATCTARELRAVPIPDGKIVGGLDATIFDYPHQVSLQYKGKHLCGGTVYSEDIILTSAYCILDTNVSKLTIVAGSSLLSERYIEIPVEKVVVHPNNRPLNNDYDVALLVLSERLSLEAKIRPIALAKERFDEGTLVTVTGYGSIEEEGDASDQLQKVDLKIVGNVKCKDVYSSLFITDRMLCAGVTGGGKDTCIGDSGSPLIVNNQLLGIVSWGIGCARADYPGVYASVPDMHDWIVEAALENSKWVCQRKL